MWVGWGGRVMEGEGRERVGGEDDEEVKGQRIRR